MKLLNIIHPYFGAIRICGAFVGDFRNENALDIYDKEQMTRLDVNYHLFANLDLKDPGFEEGEVRFEFYSHDDSITYMILDVAFKDAESFEDSNFQVLHDYLSKSEYFDDYSDSDSCWTFRNGINEIHVDVGEKGFFMQVYPPSATGMDSKDNYESGVQRTISSLIRNEEDDWEIFLKNVESPLTKRLKKYSQLTDEEKAKTYYRLLKASNRVFGKNDCYYFFRFFADMVKECGDSVRPFVKQLYLSHLASASEDIIDYMDDISTVANYDENTRFNNIVYDPMLRITFWSGGVYPSLSLDVSKKKYEENRDLYDEFSEGFVEQFLLMNELEDDVEKEAGYSYLAVAYNIWFEMVENGIEGPHVEPWDSDDYEHANDIANLPADEAEEERREQKENMINNLLQILNRDKKLHEN